MIHERTDIVEYTLDDMEAYAKEQVIKELEKWIEKGDDDGGGVFTHELYQRVNELSIKQK